MEIYKTTNISVPKQLRVKQDLTCDRKKNTARIQAAPWALASGKRFFDIALSFVLIVAVLSWLTILLGIIIKLNSRGSVFFKQKRIGKNGHAFTCYKFRTMYPNKFSDSVQAKNDDARITSLGRWLRAYHIDELPQIINIFLGDMSFVGPRPHMLSDDVFFASALPDYGHRKAIKPGLTGMAQIKGFHGYAQDIISISGRTKMDLFYIKKASFLLDVKILLATLYKPFSHKTDSVWNR